MSKRIPTVEFTDQVSAPTGTATVTQPPRSPMADRHVNLEVTPEPADVRDKGADKPGDKQDNRPYTLRISEVSLQDIASNLMFQRWVYRVVIIIALLNLVGDLLGFEARPVEYIYVQKVDPPETRRDQLRQQ